MRRAGLLTLHRWLGLILAPFLMLQALTGMVLVLHEIAPAPPPRLAGVAAFVAGAEAAAPGYRVSRLYLPGSSGPTAFAEMTGAGGRRAYAELDPVTARVRTAGGLWRFPYRAAVQLHYRLASGTPGMAVVLLMGLFLASAALAGFAFWWPGAGRVRQALKVRRGLPARLRRRQWHRSVGAVTALFALFSAGTGVLLIVPDLWAALGPVGPVAPAQAPPSPAQVDAAIAAARARFPGAALRDVRFPAADRLDINFDAPERNARAVHVVSVGRATGPC